MVRVAEPVTDGVNANSSSSTDHGPAQRAPSHSLGHRLDCLVLWSLYSSDFCGDNSMAEDFRSTDNGFVSEPDRRSLICLALIRGQTSFILDFSQQKFFLTDSVAGWEVQLQGGGQCIRVYTYRMM